MRRLARVPAAAEPEVLAVVAELARRLDERSADIAREMAFMMAHEIDQLDADAKLLEMLEASVQGNITTIIHVLANDIPIDHLQPTTAAVEYALRLAQRDVPSNSLVRAYHMGQGDLMRICHDEISTLDIPARLTLAVLKHTSDVVYSYIDWITLYVFDAYERERSRWMAAQGNLHSAAIHALLSGTNADTAAFEAETGYRLGQNHVAWWSGRRGMPTSWASIRWTDSYVISAQRRERTSRRSSPPSIDARCGRGCRSVAGCLRRIRSFSRRQCRWTAGGRGWQSDCRGGQGRRFQTVPRTATAAYSVAAVPDTPQRPVVSFGDRGVAVVSLLSENIDSTKSWVWEVLGPLAEDTPLLHPCGRR